MKNSLNIYFEAETFPTLHEFLALNMYKVNFQNQNKKILQIRTKYLPDQKDNYCLIDNQVYKHCPHKILQLKYNNKYICDWTRKVYKKDRYLNYRFV